MKAVVSFVSRKDHACVNGREAKHVNHKNYARLDAVIDHDWRAANWLIVATLDTGSEHSIAKMLSMK